MSEKSGQKVAAAVSEAQTIVEAAKRRAAEITQQAQRQLDEAKAKGYREGFERGRLDASESAITLIQDSTAIGDKLAQQAAKLALVIFPSLVEEQIKLDPALICSIAKKSLRQSIVGELVTILVHAGDRETLEGKRADLEKVAAGARLKIETDSQIRRGGCIVRTDFGEVDATVDALIKSAALHLGVKLDER